MVGDVDNEGDYACVRAGVLWEIFVPSVKSCWESKIREKCLCI